jgi:hypothetical protein
VNDDILAILTLKDSLCTSFPCATCAAHLLDVLIVIHGKESKSSLWSFLQPLRSKYPPQHPVPKYCQSFVIFIRVRDQVSHPYETAGKIVVLLCFNIYIFS